jgi:prolyl oligopeptidase
MEETMALRVALRSIPLALFLVACSASRPAMSVATGGTPEAPAPEASSHGAVATAPAASSAERTWKYPSAARGDVVDDYHGTKVADPYRWLEDPDSAATKSWVTAENEVTFAYLDQIPERKELRERLTELWNFERFGLPGKGGQSYVFTRNDGLQNQAVYYALDSLEAKPRELLDPNTMSKDGTVAIGGTSFSEDGRYFAYAVADGGSDWNTWRIRTVADGKDMPEALRWIKFSRPAWNHDNTGFYYGRYDAPKEGAELEAVNYYNKLYYHKLGTDQSADELVYKRDDHKEWRFGPIVTEDGRFLVLDVSESSDEKNRVFYKSLEAPGGEVVVLLPEPDADYSFVGNEGRTFWFLTNRAAPRGRVIAIDIDKPEVANWKELIAEAPETLSDVSMIGNHFVCNYLKDARSLVRVFDVSGTHVRDVDLPGLGTAAGFSGRRDDPETFYSYTAFTAPTTIFRYDVSTGKSSVFREPKLKFDPSVYTTEQIFYRSKDGTRVPMFLTHKQGLVRNGATPTLLYGYGGFNQSMTPAFSVSRIAWLELGGIYAVANLRGGGEYGEAWHEAGTKQKKQNVFDDFIAAAQWLIDNRYTRSDKLAIQGGSNGGLLVGACITQRPELFGAALPAVGVMDMLRFQEFTIGWAWTSDFGSSKNANEFQSLYAYSPYHRIRAGTCYPPTLITTADHDDRVVPGHSFKFAAAIQHAQACDNPVLIRIDVRSGHGAGKPTTKQIEQTTDELSFLVRELAMR